MTRAARATAAVGAADHAGWAVLVTVDGRGALLDRRRVELVDEGLPRLPYHHEAQGLPLREAEALIRRVRESAERRAAAALEALAGAAAARISALAIRRCPPLPETVAARLGDYRAQNVADTVMYRHALAEAAAARGWLVHAYDVRCVFEEAARKLRGASLDDLLTQTGLAAGPPWQKDHRVAMAAAIAAPRR